MHSRKAFPMTEYIPTPEDDELEATIGRLFDQLEAREDSAECPAAPSYSSPSRSLVHRAETWVRSMASLTRSIIGLPRA